MAAVVTLRCRRDRCRHDFLVHMPVHMSACTSVCISVHTSLRVSMRTSMRFATHSGRGLSSATMTCMARALMPDSDSRRYLCIFGTRQRIMGVRRSRCIQPLQTVPDTVLGHSTGAQCWRYSAGLRVLVKVLGCSAGGAVLAVQLRCSTGCSAGAVLGYNARVQCRGAVPGYSAGLPL